MWFFSFGYMESTTSVYEGSKRIVQKFIQRYIVFTRRIFSRCSGLLCDVTNLVRTWMGSHTSKDNPLVHSLSSTIAECTACLVRVPMEQIRNQLQTGYHSSLRSAMLDNWVKPKGFESKLAGAYRAYIPTVFRDVPFRLDRIPYQILHHSILVNKIDRYAYHNVQ